MRHLLALQPTVASLVRPKHFPLMRIVQIVQQITGSACKAYTDRKRARPAGWVAAAVITLLLVTMPGEKLHAQGGGGAQSGPTTPPAASISLKRIADRDDPIAFLLDRKKLLVIDRSLEDSLKNLRKEMRHMQDVVFKDLDKAATKKENGQPPSISIVLSLTKDSEERVKDIQSAYRDRSHSLLNTRQRAQVDSVETVWKRPPAL